MIRFGPSGNAREFYEQGKKNSEEAPEWLAQRGLNAYEYSFGRGINISDKKQTRFATPPKNTMWRFRRTRLIT